MSCGLPRSFSASHANCPLPSGVVCRMAFAKRSAERSGGVRDAQGKSRRLFGGTGAKRSTEQPGPEGHAKTPRIKQSR
jgi:hypothetical protein